MAGGRAYSTICGTRVRALCHGRCMVESELTRHRTVTGAYWSGEGVAKRIARAYGLHAGDDRGDMK